jgi:hypothetical protein
LRVSFIVLLSALAGCRSGNHPGAAEATVRFGQSQSTCARVVVRSSPSLEHVTDPMARKPDRDLHVAIYRAGDIAEEVTVFAQGYLAEDCSGPVHDESKKFALKFVANQVQRLVLALDGSDCDGGACPPVESCLNQLDDDGDGAADCADGDCLNQKCSVDGYCNAAGACVVPTLEVNCADGLDDDGNGQADCLDPSCQSKPCDDQNACTTGETCSAAGQCQPASVKECPPPANACVAAGVCEPATGDCSYATRAGQSCDGGFCNLSARCEPGYPYTPTNFLPSDVVKAAADPVTLDCGSSVFDSTPGSLIPFNGWCGEDQPTPVQLVQDGGVPVVVLAFNGLTVAGGSSLQLKGSRPVILAVFGDAVINGRLSASSAGLEAGAGGSATACGAAAGAPGLGPRGGGGAGGGFGTAGAAGGSGDGQPDAGGPSSGTIGNEDLDPLRGGCSGGNGASGISSTEATAGGVGGGALQLSVTGTLTIEGRVSASGGGGRGATQVRAGAGGGGSGGAILLEASTLHIGGSARITANGGAGGGGNQDGKAGSNGADGREDTNPASGGSADSPAGEGGDGSTRTSLPAPGEDGTSANNGGGGGGGGLGRTVIRALTCSMEDGATFSPAPKGTGCP